MSDSESAIEFARRANPGSPDRQSAAAEGFLAGIAWERAAKGIGPELIVGLTEFGDALGAGDLSGFRVTRVVCEPTE